MAWDATKPTDDGLLINAPGEIRANWDAIALGTDASLQVTNAKIASDAAIADSKLAQITTASKVSGAAITLLDSIPDTAGHVPQDNLDASAVVLSGNQTVAGVKTFSSSPIVPTPTTDYQAATKKYTDDSIAAIDIQQPPSLFAAGFGGDGSDGDVTISAPTDISGQIKQYNSLTINYGITLTAGNSLIGVKGVLTINGTISANGLGLARNTSLNSLLIPFSMSGGGGGGGAIISQVGTSGGSSGGAGGAGARTGEAGSAASSTKRLYSDAIISPALLLQCGGGGGGDAYSPYGEGIGYGEDGGGVILIECDELVLNTTGVITANGNAGTTSGGDNGSGSGGGGGGTIIVRAKTITTNTGSCTVSGGAGGAAAGNGGAGGAGGAGYAVIIDV